MSQLLLSASPHWWLTGWVMSITMLLLGLVIGYVYYDDTAESERPNDPDGEPA